jgi:WD repeat-containing protein 35
MATHRASLLTLKTNLFCLLSLNLICSLEASKLATPTHDPICSLAASDKILAVARESGTLNCYALPEVTFQRNFDLKTKPKILKINCLSTQIAVVDTSATLR